MKQVATKLLAYVIAVAMVFTTIPMLPFSHVKAEEVTPTSEEQVTITGITFEDMSVMEIIDAEWTYGEYDESGNPVEDSEYYHYAVENNNFKVTFSDGSSATPSTDEGATIVGNYENFTYGEDSYRIAFSTEGNPQSNSNQWTKEGGPYTVTGTLMKLTDEGEEENTGISSSFSYTITDGPIKNIEFTPITTIVGSGGYTSYDYEKDEDGNTKHDEETGEPIEIPDREWYEYDIWNYNYTINFNDDTESITSVEDEDGNGESSFTYGGDTYEIWFGSDQSYDNQWGVGEHTVTASVPELGYETTYTFTIIDSPIESIVFIPKTAMEGTGGHISYDYELNEDGSYKEDEEGNWIGKPGTEWYEYDIWNCDYTINFRDESIDPIVCTEDEGTNSFEYNGDSYEIWFESDQKYGNEWDVGKHTVNVEVPKLGYKGTYDFTITKSPIESIEFEDMTVIENAYGETISEWIEGDGNEEGTEVEYYSYYLENPNYTVKFKDGTEFTQTYENYLENYDIGFEYDGQYYDIYFEGDNDQSEMPLEVGPNTITASVEGLKKPATFTYTIVENPIEIIAFEDMSIIENTGGGLECEWNDETDKPVEGGWEYYHYNNVKNCNYTVSFNDGTEYKHTYDDYYKNWEAGFYYKGIFYPVKFSDTQSHETPWGKGGANTVTVNAAGYETSYGISIVEAPQDVTITYPDIEVVEETYGWMWTKEDGYDEPWFEYGLDNFPADYTVTIGEETFESNENGAIIYNGTVYYPEVYTDQNYENRWVAGGKYNAQVSIFGCEPQGIKVSILECPFKSIEIAPIKITEHAGGYWEGNYEYGDDETGESIYVEPWYYYELNQFFNDYTVILKDGTKLKSDKYGWIEYKGYEYCLYYTDTQSEENPWGVGKHTVPVSIGTLDTTVTVMIECKEHKWDNGKITKAASCTANGVKTYTCSACTTTRTEIIPSTGGHKYGAVVTTKAGFGVAGKQTSTCSTCKHVKLIKTIPAVNAPTLSATAYTYNGKAKKPSVTVRDTSGRAVAASVKYASGRKNIGKYAVTVTLTGAEYSGSRTVYFNINPKGHKLSKLSKAKKSFTAKWKKPSSKNRKQISGYQIRYSTSSKMTNAKTVTVKGNKATSKKIKKLKAKKKYYVQIRTYKTVKGVKYYSSWSAKKSVKTK